MSVKSCVKSAKAHCYILASRGVQFVYQCMRNQGLWVGSKAVYILNLLAEFRREQKKE